MVNFLRHRYRLRVCASGRLPPRVGTHHRPDGRDVINSLLSQH